jgi:hypothetical protein
MNSERILEFASPGASVSPDLLAIAADRVSRRAAISQSSAQAIMVAGFASDDIATRAWSFSISDKDGNVRRQVECIGVVEFGDDTLSWKLNGEGKVSKGAQSAYKRAFQNTFFNLADSDPAVWTMVSHAIPIARAIRKEGMTATVVNGTLKLEGGHSNRAAAMRSATSLSALAKIAKGHGETQDSGKVKGQKIRRQALPQKPIAEPEATVDAIHPAKSFRPFSTMLDWLTRVVRASANNGISDDTVFASPNNKLPSAFHPVESAAKASKSTDSSSISFAQEISAGYGYSTRMVEKIKNADGSLLGVQLGLACIAHDISVSEVARILGVTRQTIYSWFLGRALPTDKKAALIRAFLGSGLIDRNP